MTIAKCTENGKNIPQFDFDICSGFYDDDPYISFELPEECWPDNYSGAGVFTISLKDLLEQTLSNDKWGHFAFDAGEGTHKITKLLREYADKLDKSAKQVENL